MTPAAPPAPARRRRLPKPFGRRDQLSLPGLLHAAEHHPEMPLLLRPVVLSIRKAVAEYRAVATTGELVSETEVL